MGTTSQPLDDFFDSIFNTKDKGKSTIKKDEDGYTSNELLAICYGAICALILLSNLWITVLIVCSKLRRHLFHFKIIVCSIGDLIFVVVFSFEIRSSLNPHRAWQYGELFCKVSTYISETHLIFIALAICSLCADRILKFYCSRNCFTIFIHAVLFLFPFVVTFLGITLVLEHYNVVSFLHFTDINQVSFTACRKSTNYENKKILAVKIIEILQNTIFLPAVFILLTIIICLYKRKQTKINDNSIEDEAEDSICDQNNISDDPDENDSNMASSGVAVIIVAAVTVICTIPNSVLYFCSPECLPDSHTKIRTKQMIIQVLYMVTLVPSVVRPFLWLFDSGVRKTLKGAFCCCFLKKANS